VLAATGCRRGVQRRHDSAPELLRHPGHVLADAGDQPITKSLTIQGNGVDATVIDGSGNTGQNGPQARILRVNGGTVAIQDASINNGIDGSDENFQGCGACETINANGGGSLFNDGGTVALTDVAFNGEPTSSNPLGGAISNAFGSLTMTDVSFTNEDAAGGGALFVRGGTVNGVGVTFENNGEGGFDGGAAYLLGGNREPHERDDRWQRICLVDRRRDR
jgi:hypothetical protein